MLRMRRGVPLLGALTLRDAKSSIMLLITMLEPRAQRKPPVFVQKLRKRQSIAQSPLPSSYIGNFCQARHARHTAQAILAPGAIDRAIDGPAARVRTYLSSTSSSAMVGCSATV